jgi:hypothetical protein
MATAIADKLISAAALSRALDCCIPTIDRAIRRGDLTPDYIAGSTRLFDKDRIDEIRVILNARKAAR